jgi:hypothetical protein
MHVLLTQGTVSEIYTENIRGMDGLWWECPYTRGTALQ